MCLSSLICSVSNTSVLLSPHSSFFHLIYTTLKSLSTNSRFFFFLSFLCLFSCTDFVFLCLHMSINFGSIIITIIFIIINITIIITTTTTIIITIIIFTIITITIIIINVTIIITTTTIIINITIIVTITTTITITIIIVTIIITTVLITIVVITIIILAPAGKPKSIHWPINFQNWKRPQISTRLQCSSPRERKKPREEEEGLIQGHKANWVSRSTSQALVLFLLPTCGRGHWQSTRIHAFSSAIWNCGCKVVHTAKDYIFHPPLQMGVAIWLVLANGMWVFTMCIIVRAMY